MVAFPCSRAGLLTWMWWLLLLSSSEVQGQCPAPDLPPHSTLTGGGDLADIYAVGTALRLQCIPGYEYIPGRIPTIRCLDTNQWSQRPTLCQGRRCPTPNVANGRIISSNDLRLGDQVSLACDYGFRMIGDSTLRCVLKLGRVDWNREFPHCQYISCVRPPVIPNGRYDPNPLDEYVAGSVILYQCDADYSLIGNSTIVCTVAADGIDGMWNSPPPECKKVKCQKPNIQNGRVTTEHQVFYQYDSEISFQCNPGYILVGAAFVKCDANSKWNPPVPSCVESVVPTPTKPARPPTPAVPPTTTTPIPPMPDTVPPEEDGTKEVKCQRPNIQNGKVTTEHQVFYQYDSKISNVFVKCDANSKWNPPVSICVEKESLEDRLDKIEKKLDLILHTLILHLTGSRTTVG